MGSLSAQSSVNIAAAMTFNAWGKLCDAFFLMFTSNFFK
jgi:hypothetical protein